MSPDLLLGAHAFATCGMMGLIWFVQVVHYPLMSAVGRDVWVAYERRHTAKTSLVVGPLMLVEAVTTAVIAFGLAGEAGPSGMLPWLGVALLAIAWGSTFFVQVPMHRRLEKQWDDRAHAVLVHSNWIRTFAWTARAVLSILMLTQVVV